MAQPNIKFGGPIVISRENNSDCTSLQREHLQKDVDENCKAGKSKCLSTDECPMLSEKMKRISKCINARTVINKKCFRGGDAGHNEAIANAINSLVICQGYFFKKKCNDPEPVPEPIPIPVPVPDTSDEGFMKKMSELTGLTGAALIIYLIISEGSRLFPPRNLIPVP